MLKFIQNLFLGKEEPSFPTMEHPPLGTIHYIDDAWFIHRTVDGYNLDLTIPGTANGPDPQLAKDVEYAIVNFSLLWHDAKQLINSNTSKFSYESATQFTPDAIFDFVRQDDISTFVMYLSLEGDEEGVWKLEFHNRKAVSLSRNN